MSSDESRQVGAAVVTLGGDVIAVGANEVPFGGGGLHWPGQSPDSRDQALARHGEDRADEIKAGVLVELLQQLDNNGWLANNVSNLPLDQRAIEFLPLLKGTKFVNIGEFGRPVHAEMAALLDAARRGVSVLGRKLYVTTFPCHNCAKHIIAAGIRQVIYLQPYPKSRTEYLHSEEIEIDARPLDPDSPAAPNNRRTKVGFRFFSGVGPRQYQKLFARAVSENGKRIQVRQWERDKRTSLPRNTATHASKAYLAGERDALEALSEAAFDWKKSEICP